MKRMMVTACACLAGMVMGVTAGDATWNRDANGSWNDPTNWVPALVPNNFDEQAWLTNNITSNRTITLDAAITIGHLTIGDSNDSNNFIINDGSGGPLTFLTLSPPSLLSKRGTKSEVINATVSIANNLVVSNEGVVTMGGVVTENGGSYGIAKLGDGLLILTNNNSLTGPFVLGGGVVRINTTNSIGTGNWSLTNGVLESANDIIRVMGSGASQMQVPGGESGFSINNNNADRTARFGAAASTITWGSPFFNPSVFILGQSNASRQITWDNVIDLGGAPRRIHVNFTANIATMNQRMTNGTDFTKSGPGTLRLVASNSWSGITTVSNGALRLSSPGALPAGNLQLVNGVIEMNRNTPEGLRQYGTDAGQLQLWGNAGWSAHEGERLIYAGSNTATQVWGVDGFASLGALVLNGPSASGQLRFMNTLDLNGVSRTVTVNAGSAVLAGGLTNSGAGNVLLIKNGNGILLVDASATSVTVVTAAGTLQIGDYWRNRAELPAAGGNAGVLSGTAGTIVFANPGDYTNTITGQISTLGSLTKNDRGTVTLVNSNRVNGNLTVNRGALVLDFGTLGATAANVVTNAVLVMGATGFDGGSIKVVGASGGTNEQRFRALNLNASVSTIEADGTAGWAGIYLSNITRNAGATVDFRTAGDAAIFTSTTNVFGILGGYATYSGTTWAVSATTPGINPILPYSAFTDVSGGAIADAPGANVRLSGSATLGSAVTTISTLAATNDGSSASITLAGSTLRLAQRGGILLPPGAGTLTVGSAVNDGILTAGMANNTAGDLIIHNNAGNDLVVNATVTNNGSGAISLVKAGEGAVRFAGGVYAAGSSFFNRGEASFSGLTTISNINVNGGHLHFKAGSTNASGGNALVNAGRMTIEGPFRSANELIVGSVAGARATLLISNNITVSRLRTGSADNTRTAGAIFHDDGIVFSAADANGTTIADGFTTYGYYRMAGGSITGNLSCTFRGVAVFDQVGGALWPSNTFQTVNNSGTAIFNLFGGRFNAPSTASAISMNAAVEGGGTTVINLLGSDANVALNSTAKTFDMAQLSGNTAYFNLSKGSLTANQIKATARGVSVFNFDGGTLAVAGGTTLGGAFMSGLSATYIRPGGAYIDCNTNNITIGQALLAPTGYGLAAIPVTTNCGGGYIGAPYVRITGGTGAGALASAQVDFDAGVVTNFLVTSPGSGYDAADVLTVSLVGGGPLIPPTDFTISGASLAANGSGSLTKVGKASLTLTNANTYDGITMVHTGALIVSHASALGTTNYPTIVKSFASTMTGGQLQVSGNIDLPESIVVEGIGDQPPYARVIEGGNGTNTISGVITLNSNRSYRIGVGSGTGLLNVGLIQRAGTFSATLILDPVAGGRLNVGQAIDNNAGPFTCHAGGIVILSASSNDVGNTVVQNSTTLRLAAEQALPADRDVQVGQNVGNANTGAGGDRGFLYLDGVNQVINGLSGVSNGGASASSTSNRLVSGAATGYMLLTIGHTNGGGRFDGLIADGSGGGVLALTKNGTGTQVLAAASTYTGATTINAGVLTLAGEGALLSTAIVVEANAKLSVTGRLDGTLSLLSSQTLSGNGLVEGNVSNDGRIAPGASVGSLNVNGAFAQTNGLLDLEIDAGTSDLLSVTNAAVLGGTLNVTLLNGYEPATNSQFLLLQAAAITGEFASTNLPALPAGEGWSLQNLGTMLILSVTGAPSVAGYDLYAGQIPSPLDRGYQNDPDGDGYVNLLEYVTGGNPTNADIVARMNGTRTNGLLALEFKRSINATDATLYVEAGYATTNDATWTAIATNLAGSWGGAPNVSEAGGPDPVDVRVTDTDAAATNRFLRLRITRP